MTGLESELELLKWYDQEYCLDQVKQNGSLLLYVHNQTEQICLAAVKNDGGAKNRTLDVCMSAVKQNEENIRYVNIKQFPEVFKFYIQTIIKANTMTNETDETDKIAQHRHAMHNKKELLNSLICGCFYCLKIYKPTSIKKWVDNDNTAICPYCGIDSVIGNHSQLPITDSFLEQMHKDWF